MNKDTILLMLIIKIMKIVNWNRLRIFISFTYKLRDIRVKNLFYFGITWQLSTNKNLNREALFRLINDYIHIILQKERKRMKKKERSEEHAS